MPYRVELSARAERDLQIIYEFIRADVSEVAFAWFNELVQAIYTLERLPERGSITPENKRLRNLLFGGKPDTYRIIYSIDHRGNDVTVVHIRHGARVAFRWADLELLR
jgi:toxin ParE1/3/4